MLKTHEKRFAPEYVREFADGDIIFAEGDDSREMYIVQQGSVVVTRKPMGSSGNGAITLGTLQKGDFAGEMALLESLPRSATAKAKGATKLLVLQPGGFLLKIRRDPTFAFEMLQRLSRRIRVTNDRLLEVLNREGSHADPTAKIIRSICESSEFVTNHDNRHRG